MQAQDNRAVVDDSPQEASTVPAAGAQLDADTRADACTTTASMADRCKTVPQPADPKPGGGETRAASVSAKSHAAGGVETAVEAAGRKRNSSGGSAQPQQSGAGGVAVGSAGQQRTIASFFKQRGGKSSGGGDSRAGEDV